MKPNEKHLRTIDGATLMSQPLKPLNFVVDSLLSQGLHILAGSPKVGKSWLALWLSVTVARGDPVWGMPTKGGTTLYLALEDSALRIQNRLYEITEDAPANVHFSTESFILGKGLEEQLTNFLNGHPDTSLIIIDTLQLIRGASYDSTYANDYHAAMRGESWKVDLAIQIDECMKYAVNKEQFIELMESEGYQVKWTDSRANITYTTPDGKRCRDYRLHDPKYLKENMDYEFKLRAKEYAAYHGGDAGHAESGAAPQHGQGREHPEVDHADRRKLDGPDQCSGVDRTVSPEAAGERGAPAHGRADGRDAQRAGADAAGRAEHGSNRNADNSAGAEREQCQTSETGAEIHDGQSEHHAPGSGSSAEGVRETGWESQRGLLFQALQGDRFNGGFRESSAVAAVPADRRSGAVGIGAASVLAGLSAMDGESDDPEEQRRLIEARESAQNFGAIAGLAAGLAVAAHKAMQEEPAQPEPTIEPETPDMDGPVMQQTM